MTGRPRLAGSTGLAGILGLLGLAIAMPGATHPGGLDKEGCHRNRQTGDHHCHRAAIQAPAPAPADNAQGWRPSPASGGKSAPRDGRAFRNCDEARAQGAAPVRRGDPGYGPHLDRDNDGIGCEPYRGR